MRKWLALLIGTAAITLAGTALALTGLSESGDEEAATDTTVKVESTVKTTDEPVELEPIDEWMLEYDRLPESEPAEKEPVDDTPPEIVILHPEDGQVFEHKEVAFEGETEPGARVFAGEYEADVADNGAWRIVLFLGQGENVVTIKAMDSSENVGTDSVTVIYRAPEKPKAEEPKEEEPKEEEPKEEVLEWEFSAHQLYGECGEDPPYDVFYGSGKAGSVIQVQSEFGSGKTEIGERGKWDIKVIFEGAPVGEAFPVKVTDEFGNYAVFEFVRTG